MAKSGQKPQKIAKMAKSGKSYTYILIESLSECLPPPKKKSGKKWQNWQKVAKVAKSGKKWQKLAKSGKRWQKVAKKAKVAKSEEQQNSPRLSWPQASVNRVIPTFRKMFKCFKVMEKINDRAPNENFEL